MLSLLGATVQKVKRFNPQVGRYELITLFMGSNDLHRGCLPSGVSTQTVADSTGALADSLYSVLECLRFGHSSAFWQ